MPLALMLLPFSNSFIASASSSLGVVNMQRTSCPADRIVIAWSITWSRYASISLILPRLISFTTHRGSRSTQKQIPPRYWARCSTANRSRRGPEGPSISQFDPFGKLASGSVSLKFS
jgi:hypothetical protein